MKKKITLCLFILIALFGISISSFAETNSRISYDDTGIYGLIPKKENSSLEWERLDLECDVKDIAQDGVFYETENRAHSKYTIKNTSNTEITEEMVLPVSMGTSNFKISNTFMKINDKNVNSQIRHGTMSYLDESCDLSEDYINTEKFRIDTPVHKVTATVDYSKVENKVAMKFQLQIQENPNSTIVARNYENVEKFANTYILTFKVNEVHPSFEFYFIGDILEYELINNKILTITEEQTTLLDFTNSFLPNDVSKVDWFNIMASRLDSLDKDSNQRGFISLENLSFSETITTFLVFTVTFQPNTTTVIETISPFFVIGEYNYNYFHGTFYSEILDIYVTVKSSKVIKKFLGGEILENSKNTYHLTDSTFEVGIDPTITYAFQEAIELGVEGVLAFILYVIPMIVMIIFFIRQKKKKELKFLYIQKFLSFTLSLFGFFFLCFTNSIIPAIILLSGFGVLISITLFLNVTRKFVVFNNLTVEIVCLVMSIYSIVIQNYETVCGSIWIFAFIEFIFICLQIRKGSKSDATMEGMLPVGFLYGLENWMITLYFSVTISITFVLSETLDHIEIFLIPLPFIFIFYFIGMILRYRFFFLKPFRDFYKNLDLEELEKKIQKRQELPHLHPETINFYNILLAQHCLAHDRNKTREYIKKAYLPKTKGYVLAYRGMNMRYGQTKEELEHGYEVLKREYYNNKSALNSFDKFYNFWLPYYGTNPNQDITKVYNYQRKKNAYSNAISLFVLIYYYKNEKNISKVEELKKEFLSKYRNLTEFVNDLNRL